MTDVAASLASALAAYAEGQAQQGCEQLSQVIAAEPMYGNVAGLITPVRNYAGQLLAQRSNPVDAARFIETFLAHLPPSVETLQNFRASEMAGVWLDVAFYAYARGEMHVVRQAIGQVLRYQPGYLLNRGVLSIGVEAWLGQRVAATFRDAKPRAFQKRITLWRRPVLIERYFASHTELKLHVGCGGFLLPGWLNSDLSPLNRGGVLYIDATERLPFADASLDFVYSEHFIEHLPYRQGRFFVEECQRVLKPGGVCRLATPKLEFLIELYQNQAAPLEAYARDSFDKWVGGDLYSRALVINNFFHNWGHQCIYDHSTLTQLLTLSGFKTVVACEVGESEHAALQNLEHHHSLTTPEFNRLETQVVEATK